MTFCLYEGVYFNVVFFLCKALNLFSQLFLLEEFDIGKTRGQLGLFLLVVQSK